VKIFVCEAAYSYHSQGYVNIANKPCSFCFDYYKVWDR
jgi:hypothetical protein